MLTYGNIRSLSRCLLGGAALLAIPAMASSSGGQADIVVSPDPAMEQWQQRVSSELERALRTGPALHGAPDNAIVQITFSLGENGEAKGLRFYNDEGNPHAQTVARRAVLRLRNLDKVPVSNPREARFLANVIFFNDKRNQDRLIERLAGMERERLGSEGGESRYIALAN